MARSSDALAIYCATWNVCGIEPSNPSLERVVRQWLDVKHATIVCVGLCETVELSATQVMRESIGGSPEKALKLEGWREVIGRVLTTYDLVCSESLMGLSLMVLVKRGSEVIDFTNPRRALTSKHSLTALGNKGAVLARLELDDKTLCVVHSHLAAGDALHQRNRNYAELVNTTYTFKGVDQVVVTKSTVCTCSVDLLCLEGYTSDAVTASILDHSLIIWMGDLNYRIYVDPARPKATRNPLFESYDDSPQPEPFDRLLDKALATRDWAPLLSCDELITARRANESFHGFCEAEIHFPPTYKLKKGTSKLTYVANRRPAWCDRVLWRTGRFEDEYDDEPIWGLTTRAAPHREVGKDAVNVLRYDAVPSSISDHMPVACHLDWLDFWY